MFILATIAGMVFMYAILIANSQLPKQPLPYKETFKMSCDLYEVCNYTKPMFCPDLACKPEYGCWTDLRNCSNPR
jgi:hypothetical protein